VFWAVMVRGVGRRGDAFIPPIALGGIWVDLLAHSMRMGVSSFPLVTALITYKG
jgi:hypothetical protein